MSFEEMVVALVASIGGIALVGFIVAKITGLIKSWINRNNNGIREEDFNRLAKAFMEYKKDSQRRLQNLEAIIADEDDTPSPKKIEAPKKSIEIEDQQAEKDQSKSQSNDDGNLRNMLRE